VLQISDYASFPLIKFKTLLNQDRDYQMASGFHAPIKGSFI
jgi:hypothetical protein